MDLETILGIIVVALLVACAFKARRRRAEAGITVAQGVPVHRRLTGLMMASRSEVRHRVTAASLLSTWS